MSEDRDKPILADWSRHPGHSLMRERLIRTRDDYFTKLGRTLYDNPTQLTEQDLVAKAAFFRGAFWVLNQPVFDRKAIERAMRDEQGVEDV